MAKVLVSDQYLTNIANSIRTKLGTAATYTPAQMAPAILDITGTAKTLSVVPSATQQTFDIANDYELIGTINVSDDSFTWVYDSDLGRNVRSHTYSADLSGFNIGDTCQITGIIGTYNTGSPVSIQDLTGNFTWNSSNSYTKGNYKLIITASSVIVRYLSSDSYDISASTNNPDGFRRIGFRKVSGASGYNPVTVSGDANLVASNIKNGISIFGVTGSYSGGGSTPTLQAKTNITPTTSSQTITADSGYDGLSSVQINAMPSGSATAPSTISGTAATISTGTNTLTLTKTISVTPTVSAGYVSTGTAGNSSVSLTASVTTKAAATYNVSASNQTIAASQYLTGAQTIRAVTTSGISAANIKAGVTVNVGDSADADRIIGVTGTFTSDANAAATDIVSSKTAYVNGSKITGSLVVNKYYTGSSAPAANLGSNGDIYLQE